MHRAAFSQGTHSDKELMWLIILIRIRVNCVCFILKRAESSCRAWFRQWEKAGSCPHVFITCWTMGPGGGACCPLITWLTVWSLSHFQADFLHHFKIFLCVIWRISPTDCVMCSVLFCFLVQIQEEFKNFIQSLHFPLKIIYHLLLVHFSQCMLGFTSLWGLTWYGSQLMECVSTYFNLSIGACGVCICYIWDNTAPFQSSGRRWRRGAIFI